jgi:TolB-like protein/tetratricopeptide (TPR) repeat protein
VPDVFISYARQDEAVARRVARALQGAGLDVWWDADLPAHRAYSEVIERNLEQSAAVVVLWSKSAAKSQWVRAEADFARNAGKLVQAQIDGTLPPMPFNQIQCADLKGWRGGTSHQGWAKLKSSVQSLVSGDEAAPGPSKVTIGERLQPYRWYAAAAVLALIVFGVWLLAFRGAGEESKPVVAVLPFRSLDAQDASLVAGIWEDTRTAIGRNPQLVVLGPKTSQELANNGDAAARKVAEYVVQASVRAAGDKIRVSADLVRTKDGEQLWSADFDRKLDDVFALQSEIAREIEGRIRGRLAEDGGVMPQHIATTGEAYALYSDARAKIRKRESDRLVGAREQLEKVLQLDPNFAPAWAALAQVIEMIPPSEKQWKLDQPSEAYARKAIDLAPNLAAGHSALAFALNLKGPVARAELERAIQLDPSDYEALNWLSGIRKQAGDRKGEIEALRRAVEIEPLFWPAVANLYSALKDAGDETSVQALLDRERKVGGDYFVARIQIDEAVRRGDLAKATNIGLAQWATGRQEARAVVGHDLWGLLLQLGHDDIVWGGKFGSYPPPAPYLWRDEPKGVEMVEALGMPARTFLSITPLMQNTSRVYLVTGRAGKLADDYLSLHMSPDAFAAIYDDPSEFIIGAPLVALALQRTGHKSEADALLAVAQQRALAFGAGGKPDGAAWIARIYALQGRKEEALSSLTRAVSGGWLPPVPLLHNDLAADPTFVSLKGDPRFERLRQQVLSKIARERAQVNERLLDQLKAS